ncbi:MAG TPA: MFS transporter [Streptosporangiaceae bacterium]|nr:MFS transporter [Streptosporangiaceae bacterium]
MRGLVPRLGRGAWVVLAADLLSAVGTGMTLPFLLVYLHTVRGLSVPVAGAAAASIAAASLAGNPLGGASSDRIGPRATLAAGLATAGLGAYTAAFPVYATQVARIGPAMLSLACAANMVTVAGVQLVALRVLASRRRTSALAAVAAIWAFTWAVIMVAGHAGSAFAAPLLVMAAAGFAVGETALSPTVPAIVNDITPEHLRGRYNAGSTLAYTTGFMLGPVLAGLTIGQGHATALLAGLIAACCLAAVLALRLARWLPAGANQAQAAGAVAELAGMTEGP